MAKIYLVLLAVCVWLAGCAAALQETQVSATQNAAPAEEPNTWDFGQVNAGEKPSHNFLITNESTKTLQILTIHSSCGCTASEVKKKTLLPRESSEVTVTFNSKGYSGPVTQYVFVNTDDPERSIIRFVIKAQVIGTQAPKEEK